MKDISKIDYSAFDKPEILLSLFHSQKERPCIMNALQGIKIY